MTANRRICGICDNVLIADDWGDRDLICPICNCGCLYDSELMDDGMLEPVIVCYTHEPRFMHMRRFIDYIGVGVFARITYWTTSVRNLSVWSRGD